MHLVTFGVWLLIGLLAGAVLWLAALYRQERQVCRAAVERADRETRRAVRATWDLKQEQAQHEALRQRYNAEIGRWAGMLAQAPDGMHLPSYRQALIDVFEGAQETRPETAREVAA